MDLNAFDLLLLVLAGLLVLLGLLKGLTRLLIGIGALVAAFILAARFHGLAAAPVLGVMDISVPAANLIGYLAIFVGTMLAGALAGRVLRGLLKAAMLGWADRLAGAGAGFVAALLAAALIVLPVIAYVPAGERLLRNSVLAPHVTRFSDLANAIVPESLADQYRERMEALRRSWRQRWDAASDAAGEGSAGSDAAADRGVSE
jgi:membrane protein required for colicin V production